MKKYCKNNPQGQTFSKRDHSNTNIIPQFNIEIRLEAVHVKNCQ